MKNFIIWIVLNFSFIGFCNQSIAQEKSAKIVFDNDEYETTIQSTKLTIIGDKVYINWLINHQYKKCTFLLLKSFNGFEYEPAGFVNGAPTNDALVMYCFTDNIEISNKIFYKIKTLNIDDPSDVINITNTLITSKQNTKKEVDYFQDNKIEFESDVRNKVTKNTANKTGIKNFKTE